MRAPPITLLRLRPSTKVAPLHGFQLDAVILEFNDDGDLLDLRFQLGRGTEIYAAIPVDPQGRLRLLHVDSAVSHVDEPTLELDPCALDIDALEWRAPAGGELAVVGGDRLVEIVAVRASSSPSSYCCSVSVRGLEGLVWSTLKHGDGS